MIDLRDLKLFLHLAGSCHFARTAHAMHVSPSTLSRQIQRLEEELGYPLFLRDNRSVVLTEAGKRLKAFAQQTLLQYHQLKQAMAVDSPSLSGELRIFCSVTAAYSHLPPILDRFRAEHPHVEIKLFTGDPADAVEIVSSNHADISIAGRPFTLPAHLKFTPLASLPLVIIAPALPCPVQQMVGNEQRAWSSIPFIIPERGPVRRSIDLWFRRQRITNPLIYATVTGHEAIVSMVALGCGVALLPEIVIENSPEMVRNRVIKLIDQQLGAPLELGICVQKQRLHEPLIDAFWGLL